jgi:hypothetical protein
MSEDHGNQADIGIRFVAITPDVQHVGTPLFVDRMFRIASETAGTDTPGGSVAPCSIRVGHARTIPARRLRQEGTCLRLNGYTFGYTRRDGPARVGREPTKH